ncbi:MAG: hypothetical protein SGCHY_001000 [Lobulomycetales sp.]
MQVALAMTHNSFAFQPNESLPPTPFMNQNPGWTMERQLADGIRALEFDVHRDNGVLKLCHFSCSGLGLEGSSLREGSQVVLDFLLANPTEIVVIIFENAADASSAELRAAIPSQLVDMAYVHTDSAWPTYRDMIERNNRIVFFSDDSGNDDPADFLLHRRDLIAGTEFAVFDANDFNCQIKLGISSADPSALLLVSHTLSSPLFGSQEIYYPSYDERETTNSLASIKAHLDSCTTRGRFANFVSVDFGQTGDIMQAVAEYNKVSFGKRQVAEQPKRPESQGPGVRSSDTKLLPNFLVFSFLLFLILK